MAGLNNAYRISRMDGTDEMVEAYAYQTVGDFIDFLQDNGKGGMTDIVLRIRASDVDSIRMEKVGGH
jgi:hypothetical protein